MIIYSVFLHFVLKYLIKDGGLRVRYQNGKEKTYGSGEPRVTIVIKDRRCIKHILRYRSLGLGESYMQDKIDFEGDIAEVAIVARNNVHQVPAREFLHWLLARASKLAHPDVQKQNIARHYDIGNEFYRLWLDPSMTYSCGYFARPASSLEQAQIYKRRAVLKRARVEPGMHILDIGCGWGHQLIMAALEFNCTGVGITLSEEQHKAATAEAERLGLSDKLTFMVLNYQELVAVFGRESFDAIVSVGMFEHVGAGEEAKFFQVCSDVLKSDGTMLLHTITQPFLTRFATFDPFLEKYIFPGAHIPSEPYIKDLMFRHGLYETQSWNMRKHYAKTLQHWEENFEANLDAIRELGSQYDDAFIRMWRFYLSMCRGIFESGMGLTQFALRKGIEDTVLAAL